MLYIDTKYGGQVSLIDTKGRVISRQEIVLGENAISLKNISRGIYLISFKGEMGEQTVHLKLGR